MRKWVVIFGPFLMYLLIGCETGTNESAVLRSDINDTSSNEYEPFFNYATKPITNEALIKELADNYRRRSNHEGLAKILDTTKVYDFDNSVEVINEEFDLKTILTFEMPDDEGLSKSVYFNYVKNNIIQDIGLIIDYDSLSGGFDFYLDSGTQIATVFINESNSEVIIIPSEGPNGSVTVWWDTFVDCFNVSMATGWGVIIGTTYAGGAAVGGAGAAVGSSGIVIGGAVIGGAAGAAALGVAVGCGMAAYVLGT